MTSLFVYSLSILPTQNMCFQNHQRTESPLILCSDQLYGHALTACKCFGFCVLAFVSVLDQVSTCFMQWDYIQVCSPVSTRTSEAYALSYQCGLRSFCAFCVHRLCLLSIQISGSLARFQLTVAFSIKISRKHRGFLTGMSCVYKKKCLLSHLSLFIALTK